jgi:predicted phosphoribosyltransferase
VPVASEIREALGFPMIADAYQNWYDITDEEVLKILRQDNEKT